MNNSAAIENSGTYQILVSMGFSSQICKSATKIYLNDIEEAVTYCSDLSPSSIDNNDNNDTNEGTNQGINFKKCYDLLQISYPQYLSLFINWFKEDEFEDEQLIEEFIENNDYSESFFIQYIEDNIDNFLNISFNNNIAIQLFYDLNNAITNDPISNKMYNSSKILSKPPMIQRRSQFIGYSEVFEAILIDGYIREITNVLPTNQYPNIPWRLYVLCHAYYPKFNDNTINIDIDSTNNNKHLINETKSLFKSECFKLYDSLCPKELFSLLIIGKDNNIPLLTYLIDSYNRYKIQMSSKFISHIESLAHSSQYTKSSIVKYRSTHRLNNISIEEFISNKCLIFNNYPSFQDICIKSMEYLTSISKLGQSTMECQSIYRINDSLIDFTNYICETYKFIHKYTNNLSYSSMPCQFELIIIPKNVSDIDTNENITLDCDIYNLLLNANISFIELETFGIFPDLNQITQKLIGNKKNQRICILIDRRDCDKMYIYRMKDEINNEKEFINESLFNNSINCLIPNLCGCNEIEKLNGNLFSLSFHIISKYEVRIYLNINGFTTRFFITDLITYIPQFFETNNLNWILNRKSKNIQKTIENMKGIKNILSDSKFDEFYKLILMDDEKMPYF